MSPDTDGTDASTDAEGKEISIAADDAVVPSGTDGIATSVLSDGTDAEIDANGAPTSPPGGSNFPASSGTDTSTPPLGNCRFHEGHDANLVSDNRFDRRATASRPESKAKR